MYISEINFVYNQEESIMPTDKTYKKMYFHWHLFRQIPKASDQPSTQPTIACVFREGMVRYP